MTELLTKYKTHIYIINFVSKFCQIFKTITISHVLHTKTCLYLNTVSLARDDLIRNFRASDWRNCNYVCAVFMRCRIQIWPVDKQTLESKTRSGGHKGFIVARRESFTIDQSRQ